MIDGNITTAMGSVVGLSVTLLIWNLVSGIMGIFERNTCDIRYIED
jgi:hypothetical protein